MPLPSDDTAWPPPEVKSLYDQHRVDDAWFTGNVDDLTTLYTNPGSQGGASIWAGLKRWFWGTPTPGSAGQTPVKLHVPLASEVARMSASVLFGEMFTATFEDETPTGAAKPADPGAPAADPHQALNVRLGQLLDDDAHARFLEAGEYASAHGGAYLKVAWDKTVQHEGPFLTVATSDTAIPEFRYGRLIAVTFWTQLGARAGSQYRLLERHEPGLIEYGLYESQAKDRLGHRVELTAHPDAAGLAAVVDENASVRTGSPLLTAQYLPNVKPNRSGRRDLVARYVGRSDFDGAYDFFDSADETYTSWMRDVRLGKARLTVPKGAVTIGAPGQGASFNADQEIFVELGESVGSLNPAATSGNSKAGGMDLFQPLIRAQEHRETLDYWREKAVEACGYSPQSFGAEGDVAITATEALAREKLTVQSRAVKQLVARPVLVKLLGALLDVDEAVFAGPGRAGLLPKLEWPDAAADSPEIVAKTVASWGASDSASIRTRVRTLHPEWTDEQVNAEVEEIRADLAAGVHVGLGGGFDGYDGSTAPEPAPEPDPEPTDADVTEPAA